MRIINKYTSHTVANQFVEMIGQRVRFQLVAGWDPGVAENLLDPYSGYLNGIDAGGHLVFEAVHYPGDTYCTSRDLDPDRYTLRVDAAALLWMEPV